MDVNIVFYLPCSYYSILLLFHYFISSSYINNNYYYYILNIAYSPAIVNCKFYFVQFFFKFYPVFI